MTVNPAWWLKHPSAECAVYCRFAVAKSPAAAADAAVLIADDDDDEFELFGSDDDQDEAADRLKQERVAAYEAKKATSQCLSLCLSVCVSVVFCYTGQFDICFCVHSL